MLADLFISSALQQNCYRISEAESEEDAIACACDPDFLASFKTCAACVYDAAGADSTESKIVDDYAAREYRSMKQRASREADRLSPCRVHRVLQ